MRSRVIATAYGAAALHALRSAVADAKADDPMAPVSILLPNNIAGIVARRHLARGLSEGRPGIAGIYLATLPRLAEQAAAPQLSPRRPATRPIVSAAWRAALVDSPGVFSPVGDHPATIRTLTAAQRELRDLTEPALKAVAAANRLAADVVRLHTTVRTSLGDDWYDSTDLLHTATGLVTDDPKRVSELGAVVLYLPQALRQTEAAFARALADH